LVSEFGSYPSTILSKKHKPGNHLASSQPQNSGEEAQAAWLIVTAYPFLPPPTTTPDPWPAPPASERQAALAEPLQKWHLMLALSSPTESVVHGDHGPPGLDRAARSSHASLEAEFRITHAWWWKVPATRCH
jgi:hypothetical protein